METKTNSGTREIPMSDDVYECFKKIKAFEPKSKENPNNDKNPIHLPRRN